MPQNRASLFASDFYRRRGYRREFRSEDHFYQYSSQKKSRFASDFLRRGNRAPWALKKSRDFSGSGKNRSRNRRESRDFGALSGGRKQARNHSAAEITGFFAFPAAKKSLAASDLGLASKSQENRSDHSRKSPQPRDFAAAATTGHLAFIPPRGNTPFEVTKNLQPFLGLFQAWCYFGFCLVPAFFSPHYCFFGGGFCLAFVCSLP